MIPVFHYGLYGDIDGAYQTVGGLGGPSHYSETS